MAKRSSCTTCFGLGDPQKLQRSAYDFPEKNAEHDVFPEDWQENTYVLDQLKKNAFWSSAVSHTNKMNLTIGCRFRRRVVVSVQVWVYGVRICVELRYRVGSLGSIRTSDFRRQVRFYRFHSSRLRSDSTFLSSDSESTQTLGSIRYLVDLLDFRMPRYGSVSDFRLKVMVKFIFCERFNFFNNCILILPKRPCLAY